MSSVFHQMEAISSQLDTTIQLSERNVSQLSSSKLSSSPTFFLADIDSKNILVKRIESKHLEDLLTKKLKTESTGFSESSSGHRSPLSENFSNEKIEIELSGESSKENSYKAKESAQMIVKTIEEPFEKDSQSDILFEKIAIGSTTYITRCPSLETNDGSVMPEDFASTKESLSQIQRALDLLKERMIEQDKVQSMSVEIQLPQDSLFIPLLLPLSNLKTTFEKKEQIQSKKILKKLENEQEFTYGNIEFPFLCISTPFSLNDHFNFDSTSFFSNLFQNFSEITEKRTEPFIIPKPSISSPKRNNKINGVSPKRNHGPNQESMKSINEENTASGSEIKSKENNKIDIRAKKDAKEEVIRKKNKENEKDKKGDKETEKDSDCPKNQQQNQENIYSRPSKKRQAERRKNRWQVAQDEKVKDIISLIPNLEKRCTLFFEGSKKKSANTPVGPEFQVDVSTIVLQSKPSNRRKPKIKWDPSSHRDTDLAKFFKDVEILINCRVDQEEGVKLIMQNRNNIKRAFEYIKAHKSKCFENLCAKGQE